MSRKPIQGDLADLSQADRFYRIKRLFSIRIWKYRFVIRLEIDDWVRQ